MAVPVKVVAHSSEARDSAQQFHAIYPHDCANYRLADRTRHIPTQGNVYPEKTE